MQMGELDPSNTSLQLISAVFPSFISQPPAGPLHPIHSCRIPAMQHSPSLTNLTSLLLDPFRDIYVREGEYERREWKNSFSSCIQLCNYTTTYYKLDIISLLDPFRDVYVRGGVQKRIEPRHQAKVQYFVASFIVRSDGKMASKKSSQLMISAATKQQWPSHQAIIPNHHTFHFKPASIKRWRLRIAATLQHSQIASSSVPAHIRVQCPSWRPSRAP